MKSAITIIAATVITLCTCGNVQAEPPDVTYSWPTPDDGATVTEPTVQVEALIAEIDLPELPDLTEATFQWGGVDYALYDSSLVLMFNFNNVYELGEDYLSQPELGVRDISLCGNDGHLGILGSGPPVTGIPTWTESAKFGGAFDFSASTSESILVPHDPSLNPGAGDFTIAFWILPRENIDSDIMRKGSTLTSNDMWYKLEHSTNSDNKISLNFNTNGTNATIYSTDSYADYSWHFVVAQRKGDQAELWIDGVLDGTAAVTGEIYNDANLTLGSKDTQDDDFFNGMLDEVRIYMKSFSADGVQLLYDSMLGIYPAEPTKWALDVTRSGLENGDYTYAVSATNALSETTTNQRTVTVALPAPPDVTLAAPPNGSVLNNPTVTFRVDAADPVGLIEATLYIGTPEQVATFSGPAETDDAQISATNPDTTYGSATSINVDGENPHAHAVIKFPNLIGSGPEQVPSGAIVVSATLQVNCTNLGAMMQVYRLTSDWAEGTVTWNSPWDNPGGDYDPGTVIDGDCTATGLRTIDITEFVQAWGDGTANYGILLADSGGTDGVDFDSSEGAIPPVLTVVYAGDWQAVDTQEMSGTSGTATFANVVLQDMTDYVWNCLVTNAADPPMSSWAAENFNLSIDGQTPDEPVLVGPADGATDVTIPATLEVTASDPQAQDVLDVTFYGRKKVSGAGDFTIVVLPDTQKYAESYPDIFTSQTQWIVDNKDALNIVFVTHEGDIVQTWNSTTQWDRANTSMSLLDGVVPYSVVPGDHDHYGEDPPGSTEYYEQYFPASRFSDYPWWGESYAGNYGGSYDETYPHTNNNNYQLLTIGGQDYIFLSLDFCPSQDEMDWANGILTTYSERKGILTTHGLLDTNANYYGSGDFWLYPDGSDNPSGDTSLIWYDLIRNHENLQLVLCGHMHGEARRTDDNLFGKPVHQLLANYQGRTNGGNGWLRIMRFVPAENKIYVQTYSPWLNEYETDAGSQFELDVPLNWYAEIGTNLDVASGSNTSVDWTDLGEGDECEWYVTVTDSTDRTSFGPVWSFNTVTRKATNPSPADGATDVVLDADLSWTAGVDAVSHDVYFGTDVENLTLVSAGQTTTTYDPGALQQGMTYYWTVDEHDSEGVTAGDTWSFTTITMKATNPDPANGATNVRVNPDLSWTAGADAVSHDVYFGTDAADLPLVSAEQPGTIYDPGTLAQDTTYYWAIDERDSGPGVTAGDIWSFTTAPPSLPYSEDFESFTLGETVGFHSDWYDGGAGPVVTSGIGVGGSVGLGQSGTMFTWTAQPFVWTEVNKVIIGMDFQTDGSGHLDDDRIGWMISNASTSSSDIFGIQLDPGGSGYNIEGYWDGSTADRRPTIVDLPDLSANAWYRLRAEFTRLANTSAGIDVELWSLDAGGNPVALIVEGSIADTSLLGADAPHSKYFPGTSLWPGYKNHTAVAGAVDNAYFEEVPVGGVPPVISNVQTSDITDVSATITWTTNKPSDSVVRYGETTSLGSELSDAALVTSHSLTLTGLSSDTLYYYEVESTDAEAGTAIDNNGGAYYSFTAVADLEDPIITSPTGNTVGTTSDSVAIQATITDNDDVAGATVYYTPIGGVETSVPMTEGASDVWSALVPVAIDKVGDITYYITAQDPVPNSSRAPSPTGTYTIAVTDNDAPTISGATGNVSADTQDTVPISATITDNIDVVGATLHYTPVGGSETTIPMAEGADDLWSGSIPTGSLEGAIPYYITAEDAAPNTATNPPTGSYTITVTAPGPTTLFSDGFESGNLTTGGWQTSGDASITTTSAYTGIYGVQLRYNATIEKAVSTVGYGAIHVKYARVTERMDSGEFLYVEWFDGTQWKPLEQTQDTSWSVTDLGTAADNNAAFKLRFRMSADKVNEYGRVDSVEITGTTAGPVNNPPVANDDTDSTNEDTDVTILVLANDTDADPGDTLSVQSATNGSNGSVVNNGDSVTYTPNANFNGTDVFTYTVSDGKDGTDTGNVTVTVLAVNDPPSAGDDSAATNEDTAVVVDVLANDSDIDGDTLSVESVGAASSGNVANNGNSVTYTPNPGFVGSDSFTYTVADGKGGTDTATVSITVTEFNNPPVANDDTDSTNEDTDVTILVLANDTDADPGDTLSVQSATNGSNGSVVNNGDSVTYTPNANFNGTDVFTYTVSDGKGGTDTGSVTVTVLAVNDPPSAGDDSAATDEDTAVVIDVLANDSDIDGDTLSVESATNGSNGIVVVNGDNTVTYTPDAAYNGDDSFTYTISDGKGGTDTATVTITVNPAGSIVYVASIDMLDFVSAGRNSKAVVGITLNAPEAGATVLGDWYFNGEVIQTGASGTTDAGGYTEIVSVPVKAKSGDVFRFVITDVGLSGYTYDSNQGVTENSITFP